MSDESRDETGENKEENQMPVFSAFKGVGGDDALVEALKRHMQEFDFDGFAETLERVGHEPD